MLEFVERDERLFLLSNRLILVRGAHLDVLMSQLWGFISSDFSFPTLDLHLLIDALLQDPNPLMAGLEAQAPSQIPSQSLSPRDKPASVHTENIAEEVKL
jgi:hypothetical protein